MKNLIPVLMILLLPSQSIAQQTSEHDKKPAPQKCDVNDPFLCIGDPGKNFPWFPPPKNDGIANETPPDFRALEKLDQQFEIQKEMWK